jgi:hypothetical protein
VRLRYLEEDTVRIRLALPDAVRATCEIAGEGRFDNVEVIRCFPLTLPDRYITLIGEDGNELGVVRDPALLDAESREAVESLLARRYFTPEIQRIDRLTLEASLWRWQVTTNRGSVTFYLRGVRDSIHEVAPGRWQIFSVDGQRYEIRDLGALDARSRALFEGLF